MSLYHRQDPPECVNLTYNFDKSQTKDQTLIPFDDFDLALRSARSTHLQKICVSSGKLIQGLQLTYLIDGRPRQINHNATSIMRLNQKKGQYKQIKNTCTIQFDDFEHIEYIECTYSERGVHSI